MVHSFVEACRPNSLVSQPNHFSNFFLHLDSEYAIPSVMVALVLCAVS